MTNKHTVCEKGNIFQINFNLILKGLKHFNTVLFCQKAFDISTDTTAFYHCLPPLPSTTGLKHFTKLLHLNNHKEGHSECYSKFIKHSTLNIKQTRCSRGCSINSLVTHSLTHSLTLENIILLDISIWECQINVII